MIPGRRDPFWVGFQIGFSFTSLFVAVALAAVGVPFIITGAILLGSIVGIVSGRRRRAAILSTHGQPSCPQCGEHCGARPCSCCAEALYELDQ